MSDVVERLADTINMMDHTGQAPCLEVDALDEIERLRAVNEKLAEAMQAIRRRFEDYATQGTASECVVDMVVIAAQASL